MQRFLPLRAMHYVHHSFLYQNWNNQSIKLFTRSARAWGCAPDMENGSEDSADVAMTVRVLTVMLTSEE